ncbi:MAG: hypothetical protein IKR13_04005 [Victivallales bacterium]|nr:hypothetical protein [Victivallales bacterium]
MNQTNKVLLAIALLIIAGGLFAWHFKPRSAAQAEEPQETYLETDHAKALKSIFSKVGSKKWSNASLWSSDAAAKKYQGDAENYFTANPSMDDVKILGCGTNKGNFENPIISVQVLATKSIISVEFKAFIGNDPNKTLAPDKWVIDSITLIK